MRANVPGVEACDEDPFCIRRGQLVESRFDL